MSGFKFSGYYIFNSSSINFANEALSKKDFIYRIKLCRKEAKETVYWIRLLDINDDQAVESKKLIQESEELTKIFGTIYRKVS